MLVYDHVIRAHISLVCDYLISTLFAPSRPRDKSIQDLLKGSLKTQIREMLEAAPFVFVVRRRRIGVRSGFGENVGQDAICYVERSAGESIPILVFAKVFQSVL